MDKTRDFISSPEIDKMKDGVILLNFARNGIVRSSSLLEALDSGKIAQYVTDFPTADILSAMKRPSVFRIWALLRRNLRKTAL